MNAFSNSCLIFHKKILMAPNISNYSALQPYAFLLFVFIAVISSVSTKNSMSSHILYYRIEVPANRLNLSTEDHILSKSSKIIFDENVRKNDKTACLMLKFGHFTWASRSNYPLQAW
jgi:hypothetical protein